MIKVLQKIKNNINNINNINNLRYFCTNKQSTPLTPPTNNYRHNYFSEVQNYKSYEDDNELIKKTNNDHSSSDSTTSSNNNNNNGIFGSIKNQMLHLSKITKFGIITLLKDRAFYKNNLLPKAAILNEPFTKRILPTFPIHNQNSFKYLNYHDRKSIISYRMDRLTMIPLSIFLSIPFSTLLLPFYLKFLPGLLPRGFSERSQVLIRHERINNIKRHVVEKLIEQFKIENEIQSLQLKSLNDINPLKLKSLFQNSQQNRLDFHFEEMNRETLKRYTRSLGHTTFLNTNDQLINKILNSANYILQENDAILNEINNLTFEDLQDLLYSRSLEFKGLNYYELKTKFMKYAALLKSISVISNTEDGIIVNNNSNGVEQEQQHELYPHITLSNRYQNNFYKQFILFNLISIHYKL